jgi:predicted  nucleic acid-binding Zn-ribbon protein
MKALEPEIDVLIKKWQNLTNKWNHLTMKIFEKQMEYEKQMEAIIKLKRTDRNIKAALTRAVFFISYQKNTYV